MIQVTLPQLSLAMEEGRVVRWLVADGDRVSAGQPIVEIETDKATAEVEAPSGGRIHVIAEAGAPVAVDSTLAEIVADKQPSRPSIDAPPSPRPVGVPTMMRDLAPSGPPEDRLKHSASPAARRFAKEHGIHLSTVSGSGPDGRITVSDLERVASAAKSSLRDAVVKQVSASWREIPHIHVGGELDGTGIATAKQGAGEGITVTDLLVVAVVRALKDAPELNGIIDRPSRRVHLALAVATPNGVVAPVIRDANTLSLAEIARERSRLVSAARMGHSDPRDLAGGTITLSNLGPHPVDFFAPVISGPQIAIVATGRLVERPVVVEGVIAIRHRIWINVAFDHRATDGITGARFLAALERCFSDLPTLN